MQTRHETKQRVLTYSRFSGHAFLLARVSRVDGPGNLRSRPGKKPPVHPGHGYQRLPTPEPTQLVSANVPTSLSKPCLIALVGYSGAGKTHTRRAGYTRHTQSAASQRSCLRDPNSGWRSFEQAIETGAEDACDVTKIWTTESKEISGRRDSSSAEGRV